MKWQVALLIIILFLILERLPACAQQIPDTTFKFYIPETAYKKGQGPLILIDGAHNNFHTIERGYLPFIRLLEQDGYKVEGVTKRIIEPNVLEKCEILVISNALHESNLGRWVLPTPSAFTEEEIKLIKKWVEKGGKLLLIADHMPFAGAAYELGKAFGFEFLNGFAMTGTDFWPPSVFTLTDSTLPENALIKETLKSRGVQKVATFTGSAFKIPKQAVPVLSFKKEHISLQPDTAWRFNQNTERVHLKDHYQGALLEYGKGKVAVFGEAAMFTAQIAGSNKAGFNSEYAPENAQFTLNLIHWLDGIN